MSQRTGRDYKWPDKVEQGKVISKLCHFDSAPCRADEILRHFCMSMRLRVPGQVRDTCFKVSQPLGLHHPPALNEHD